MFRLSERRKLRLKYTGMAVGYFFLFLVIDTFVQALWHQYRGEPFEALPATEWAAVALVAAAVTMGNLAAEFQKRFEELRSDERWTPTDEAQRD
ncbi:MAG: hypothetical protein KY455_12260 [Euryarchaeota archaeon]|nr:hypothetical protein [Euryarchaeota archaeon]